MTVHNMTKKALTELEDYTNQNFHVEESENKRTITIPYFQLAQWKKFERKYEHFSLASKLLPRSLVVSLVSQYDAYLGRILRAIFIRRPELLNNSERKLTFEDLASLETIENARDLILEKEVESILRSSHADQFGWMERNFKINLTKGLNCWPDFIELTERRNLFVHTDGIVSKQYLTVCKKHQCKINTEIDEGATLWVSPQYFHQAHECIFEIGVKLGHVLWRKLFPDDRNEADSHLIDLTYDLIDQGRYSAAISLLDFAFEGIKKFSSEASELSLLINRAQAYKWNGSDKQCQEILNQVDWSAKAAKFQLANAVLTDRFDDAQLIMRSIGSNGSLTSGCYKDWPLFKRFRESKQFLDVYAEIFGEDFATYAESITFNPPVDDDSTIDGNENIDIK